jgi:chloramphenicol O-acetyltransferase type A
MAILLDLENWKRKEHFEFFSSLEEPFFGVTVEVDVSKLYHSAKENGHSFYLRYLHASLKTANEIEHFKYRITEDKNIEIHDRIDASPTVNREDGTFGFSYMTYYRSFSEFANNAREEMARVRNFEGLGPPAHASNVIHYSALPWLKFTSVSHARGFSFNDSIPKISFGKVTKEYNKRIMPVSIHVHHGLMDGHHVGLFVEKFQDYLDYSLAT